jgi:hypothetical protein
MSTTDEFDVDERLAAHLRRTLQVVAETVTVDDTSHLNPRAGRRPGPKIPKRLLAAAAAIAFVIAGFVTLERLGGDDHSAWAADAFAVAESAPRLLVTADHWEVTRADEFQAGHGELTFSGPGAEEATVNWGLDGDRSGYGYHDRIREWTETTQPVAHESIAGRPATIFRDGSPAVPAFAAIWPENDHGVELRGRFPDLDAFLQVAASVRRVDVDTWLSAMPESVVRAETRAAAIRQMLADIPVPAGFDTEALIESLGKTTGPVSDRYQLGARVTARVTCSWIRRWVEATRGGDALEARQAAEAMATSHDWDILREMEDQGDWPNEVWLYADAIRTGGVVNGQEITKTYAPALGCDSA